MKKLFKTDYVIYDKANDHVVQFEISGEIVVFGNKDEAEENCRGNETVISCTDLPLHHQEILLKQLVR
ncbi:MAG: hypothetical protein ACJAVA_000286 [Flavobacteriaceae bacterium]|jgi:hypothetical protein